MQKFWPTLSELRRGDIIGLALFGAQIIIALLVLFGYIPTW
jgi:hypothetical protein